MNYELKSGESFIDFKTAHYYSTRAAILVEKYATAIPEYTKFSENSPDQKKKLLDIGCGSGRDMVEFQKAGYIVSGADVSEEMLKKASEKYPSLKHNLMNTGLPGLAGINGKFDVILCSGVIQHIQTQFLYDSIRTITNLLNDDGIFIFSFPIEYPGINPKTFRDNDDRLFIIRPEEKYRFLIERQGLSNISREFHKDSLNRSNISWAVHVYRKEKQENISALSKIDSILRDDSKNTTYKFALLRALSDIASYSYNSAEWYHNSTVGIDIKTIIIKWIEYFWPIITSSEMIYQGSNNISNNKADITFRPYLQKLAECFGGSIGQGYFRRATDSNDLSIEQKAILKKVSNSIKRAIITGPIQYCGNSKTGKIFRYNNGKIIIPTDIWKEFILMGRWIEDSIILRWADFTVKITTNKSAGLKLSSIMDLLIHSIELKRDTKIASNIIAETSLPIECVWSGKKLKEYDIDHALPFSIWRNNDLWNLFPADKKINNSKSDKLPTIPLLNYSKKRIYDYWNLYYETKPVIFLKQANNFCGEKFLDFTKENKEYLFSAFLETVDYAALQRGIERWEL